MLNSLRKYSRLFLVFLKASFIADLEYRANFTMRILTDFLWYFGQIATFKGLFFLSPKLGQWNSEETMVFLGVLFVVDAVYMILFSDNLDQFSERVSRGELDLILAKPVNSQFMVSLQKMNTAIIGNLILASSWLIYSLNQLPQFSWLQILWFCLLLPAGVMTLYSLRFLFAGFTVIFSRAENLQYLFFQIYRLGMRPDSIYSPAMKFLIFTIIPVGVIASIPSRYVIHPESAFESPLLLLWALGWSLCLIKFSNLFWSFCLRKYSSASS